MLLKCVFIAFFLGISVGFPAEDTDNEGTILGEAEEVEDGVDEEKCKYIDEELGLVTIKYLEIDDRKLNVIEINPRVSDEQKALEDCLNMREPRNEKLDHEPNPVDMDEKPFRTKLDHEPNPADVDEKPFRRVISRKTKRKPNRRNRPSFRNEEPNCRNRPSFRNEKPNRRNRPSFRNEKLTYESRPKMLLQRMKNKLKGPAHMVTAGEVTQAIRIAQRIIKMRTRKAQKRRMRN